ncbi:tetratricopeptide repeat protein 29-like [Tribolium madens]|uniref:tetratricopeptide repeat protein 29-like n=1 Tax=Tribolium madens TaxID=41895 RepID=UPI001CF7649E|nr:tetratricopeptide repeat protein 29-like [Tribolium madens]
MSHSMSIPPDPEEQLIDFNMSPIKKEQMKRHKKRVLQQKLRDELPVLTLQEIRRFRLPYHEALLAELTESGYTSTAEFIKQLLDLQEKTRKKAGPGTHIWLRPQLINSKQNLDLLTQYLTKAERAHNAEDFATEWEQMLHLAAHYAFGPDDWWWLGEQLLYQCVSMEYPGDFQKQEAIAYFIIGKYLVENGKKAEAGKNYLDLAREMSQGKSWNCTKILNKKQDIVFIESCRLLYKSLMEEAQILMKTDPARASEICNIARKRASEACEHKWEYTALIIRGRCEVLLKRTSDAIATITKALNRAVRRKDVSGICDAKISMALAYLQHGKAFESLECLKELKQLAEDHDLQFYTAQAYRYMGEYYLNQEQPYEATPLLMLAFYIFNDIKDLERREKVRTWAAISAGEELFPAFIRLIKKCDGDEGHENIMKLIKWIDEKEFFWTQQSKFSFSYTSLQQSVLEFSMDEEVL